MSVSVKTWVTVLVIAATLQLCSALFVPNITSADDVIQQGGRKAYINVNEIHNATLRFFNNGTYFFEVKMPCGILNNRVLAVEAQSRLKLEQNQQQEASRQRGRFQQHEIVVTEVQAPRRLTPEEQREQQISLANQRRFLQAAALAEQLQQPVRFANAIIQPVPLQPQIQPLSAVTTPVPVVFPSALLPQQLQADAVSDINPKLKYRAVHPAQRCTCSCEDEQSGEQTSDVKLEMSFSAPKRKQEPLMRQHVQLAAIEVQRERERQRTKRQAEVQNQRNRMCLYIEEGSWPDNQDGFIKSLAPSRQSQNLDTNDELEQCRLRFDKKNSSSVDNSFSIECRGTARCERGQAEPTCADGVVSNSKFNVANGELVLSVEPRQ